MIALLTSAASLLVGFAALTAITPWKFGTWFQSEPQEVALYAIGALSLIAYSCTAFSRVRITKLAWVPLALGLLSLLEAPLHHLPLRSVFGPPETGEGAAWYFAVAGLVIVGAEAYRTHPHALNVVAWATALGYLSVVLVEPALLGRWSDWLAWIGFALAVAARPAWLAAAVGLVLVGASGSKGAALLAVVIIPGVWAAIKVTRECRWVGALLCGAIPILATFAIDFVNLPSAQSRGMLQVVTAAAFGRDPTALLDGVGWGAFNDLVLTAWPTLASVDPTWEGLGAGAFHSHNLLTEATLALGLPGLALALLSCAAVPLWGRKGAWSVACWAGFCGLQALWFPTAVVAPFIALALASRAPETEEPRPRLQPLFLRVPAGAAAALLVAVAVSEYRLAAASTALWAAIGGTGAPVVALPDPGRGDQHLWWLAVTLETDVARKQALGVPIAFDELRWRAAVRDAVQQAIDTGRASARLAAVEDFGPYK